MALIVALAVGGAIASSSSKSTVNRGTRAVIVPTADAARTVIVAPCGTGANVLSASPATLMNTSGAISLELPQGNGVRVVLVPRCTGARGGLAGTSNLPSAAFVPRQGSPLPSVGSAASSSSSEAGSAQDAQFQLTVPDGSPIRTIIVSPCEKPQVSGPAERILGATGSSTTAIAPPC